MYDSVILSKPTDLRDHHYNPILEHFMTPPKIPCAYTWPLPLPSAAQVSTILLSVSINLATLDTVFVLL